MFKLNLKIALRNIWKYKLITSLKMSGLIIGLSTVVLLLGYVLFELSYDQYNDQADQIYRLQSYNTTYGKESISLPSGLGATLVEELPDVVASTQLNANEAQVKVGEIFYTEKLITTQPSFFKMFSVPLVKGDTKTALTAPHTAIVSESFAKKAFPDGRAIGQQIKLRDQPELVEITGIMKDIPAASHFHAAIAVKSDRDQKLNWRTYTGTPQYIMVKKGVSAAMVEKKMKLLYAKYKFPDFEKISLMPLKKIHLYSHTADEFEANSNIKYIYIFSAVAALILLIALVNFINLTVAASLKRGKEIGIKKVMGASLGQLRMQFLSESYVYFIAAGLLVLVITYDLIPLLGAKLGIELSLSSLLSTKMLLISLGIVVLAGFVAGLYPAMILSRLMPVKTLKGITDPTNRKFGLKKVLIIFQFSISGLMIICTFLIYSQLQYIKTKDLGFDKDQILVSSFNIYGKNFKSFKEELLHQPGVKSVSLSSFEPGKGFGGATGWTDKEKNITYEFDFIYADIDFINTLNIRLSRGRGYSRSHAGDLFDFDEAAKGLSKEEAEKLVFNVPIVLNEAAVKRLAIKDPVNKPVNYTGVQGKIIGVVNDFNGMSLHNEVKPLVILFEKNLEAGYLYVKVNGKDVSHVRTLIAGLSKKYFPDRQSDMQFMDQHLEHLYQSEMRLGTLFLAFACIAVFLSCMGLFGMVYFEMEHRTKEIAVRKVLGASIPNLLALLNGSFIKVVLVANVLIWPVAYYIVRNWLNSFYYRIEISYLPFLGALAICILLTLLTVSVQAVRAVKTPPVDALKYE